MKTKDRKTENRSGRLVVSGLLLLLVSASISLFLGTKTFSSAELFQALTGNGTNASRTVMMHIRIPRTLAGILCGAALSCSGLLLQEAMGNALASPGIIGVNAGAGFFAVLAGLIFPYSLMGRTVMAFAGAIAAVVGVYLIAMKADMNKRVLILAGVAVSSLMTAGTNTVITLFPDTVTDKVMFSLGGLQGIQSSQIMISAVVTGLPLLTAFLLSPGTDLFSLGDETAEGLGLNVRRHRLLVIITAGAMAAAAVSMCGLLGFLGLIVPNMIRSTGERPVRKNLVLSMLFGSSFLVLCDVISRTAFYPYELPVGLLLSLLGAPFFIWLLIGRRNRRIHA